MERDFRLLEPDMLDNKHFPIVAFFNSISNANFVDVVERMSSGIGTGINATVCVFPDDLDPEEEKFEGVLFALHCEEVVADYQTFIYYLKRTCEIYLDDFPKDRECINALLGKIMKKTI